MSPDDFPPCENTAGDGAIFLDIEITPQQEAKRRLYLLGECASSNYDRKKAQTRARSVRVPWNHFRKWMHCYGKQKLAGLLPEWTDWMQVDEESRREALEVYHQLGALADAEFVTKKQVDELLDPRTGTHTRRMERAFVKYRTAGFYGLTTEGNPEKKRCRPESEPPGLANITNEKLEQIVERMQLLGDAIRKKVVTEEEVGKIAVAAGRHPRTIRRWIQRAIRKGMAGLQRLPLSDRGSRRGISAETPAIIRGLRFSALDRPIHAVYDDAVELTKEMGVPDPSPWQVRDICAEIPKGVRLRSDKRWDRSNNEVDITYPIIIEGVVYQGDSNEVPVFVLDLRDPPYRNKNGQVRPWLVMIIEANSRAVVAALFFYDKPDQFMIARAIYESLFPRENKPGGVPDEFWRDNEKVYVAEYVCQILDGLQVKHPDFPGHAPEKKGARVERAFGTLDTELWADTAGYAGKNPVERNPNVKAELTISQLVEKFWNFIAKYHNRVHSETGQTPLEYWNENCHLETPDRSFVGALLQERAERKVSKEGISYKNVQYWHEDLGVLVDKKVVIRAGPSYSPPDEIEVYDEGKWFCTAFAQGSKRGRMVTQAEVGRAKRKQKAVYQRAIDSARDSLAEARRAAEKRTAELGDSEPQATQKEITPSNPRRRNPKKEEDPWDSIGNE